MSHLYSWQMIWLLGQVTGENGFILPALDRLQFSSRVGSVVKHHARQPPWLDFMDAGMCKLHKQCIRGCLGLS